MKPLVLMYVYFDKNGDIKAISPSETLQYSKDYEHTMLPLEEVEAFILGKKNSFEYAIKKINRISGSTYKLTKKFNSINFVRTLDNYLTRIPNKISDESIIRIVIENAKKKAIITLNENFKQMYEYGTEEEKEEIDKFNSYGISWIYLTEENNPYKLITAIDFSPKELFDKGKLYFDIKDGLDLKNSSAYTKRLVSNYTYAVKE